MKKIILLVSVLIVLVLGLFFVISREKSQEGIFKIFSIPNKPVRLLFLGDTMLDRTIRRKADAQSYEYLFSCISDRFETYDAVVLNLEGPVTTYDSVSVMPPYNRPQSMQFTFAPESVSAIVASHVDIVSIGNNHIYDFGREGIEQTYTFLNNEDVLFFGSPEHEKYRSATTTIGTEEMSFVVFNEFFGTSSETVADIVREKEQGRFVVVFAHWGDEYVPATARVKSWAREFVDAGADLVIGAHPHVVQESEMYKNVPIFYSLGNFIFDQYFSEAVQNGLALEVHILDGVVVETIEHPVELLRDGRTCFKNVTQIE